MHREGWRESETAKESRKFRMEGWRHCQHWWEVARLVQDGGGEMTFLFAWDSGLELIPQTAH